MSHFSRIRTQLVEKELLLQSLADLGYEAVEGEEQVRGFAGARMDVEIRIPVPFGYDIGFRKGDQSYEIVADWFGVRGIKQKEFVEQVSQRYAYHATRAKLEAQGFSLVSETNEQDGGIRLVLRRMA